MGPSPTQRLIPIRTEFLQPGMYVAELDRSWLHSPFRDAGFLITGQDQIEQLRQVCAYVYVDPALGDVAIGERLTKPPGVPPARPATPLNAARRLLQDALHEIAGIVRDARRQGKVDVAAVGACATLLADQVCSDADTLHLALRLEEYGGYLYRRAVGTAVVAVTLGRQIGLDRPALRGMAAGGLLLDIGKIAVPIPILAKPLALHEAEQAYVRRHVERGMELVAGSELPPRALEMIAGHHERTDGSGYPHQLRGTQIPLFARLAAIADAYDAMTLNRRYAAAISPHAALRQLDALRAERYDSALVNELVRALGLYPVGTLLELSDGRLGVVCGQQPRHPLQPHLVITHDGARRPLADPRVVTANGATEIVRSLPPSVATIDLGRLGSTLRSFHNAA